MSPTPVGLLTGAVTRAMILECCKGSLLRTYFLSTETHPLRMGEEGRS